MSTTVTVTDMSCDGCEDIVEDAVGAVQGVESVEADRDAETVIVEGDADVDAVLEAIDFAGYSGSLRDDEPDAESDDEAAEDASEGEDDPDAAEDDEE